MSFNEYDETVIGGVRYKVSSIYADGKRDFPALYQSIIVDRVLRHIEQQNSIGPNIIITKFVIAAFASAVYIAAVAALLNMGGLR